MRLRIPKCTCGCKQDAEKCGECEDGYLEYQYTDEGDYGAYDDKKYRCDKCGHVKWSESADY